MFNQFLFVRVRVGGDTSKSLIQSMMRWMMMVDDFETSSRRFFLSGGRTDGVSVSFQVAFPDERWISPRQIVSTPVGRRAESSFSYRFPLPPKHLPA